MESNKTHPCVIEKVSGEASRKRTGSFEHCERIEIAMVKV
jgi:hypothetical protein